MTACNLKTRALALLLVLTSSACVAPPSVPRCVPGMTLACACASGERGAQACQSDGRYAACVCDGRSLDAGIEDAARTRDVAATDARTPRDAARADSPLCFDPREELCDGRDNDCDGIADEGHVCPDDSIHFTEPFAGGVWFRGTLTEGLGGQDAVQRFWPSVTDGYHRIYDSYVSRVLFRQSDGALYFSSSSGLHEASPGEPTLPTLPCVNGPFGFDDLNRAYYVCGETLFRDGMPLLASISWLEAVLPSGRSIVVRPDLRNATFLLLDVDGTELSRLSFPDWSGTFSALTASSSVQGERAWLMVAREIDPVEYVVVRVDGNTGAWDVVRRLRSTPLGPYRIALPNGHVLFDRQDAFASSTYEFVDLPPDGPPRVVWREADAPEVRLHGATQFIAGPLE